jgi:hypothetical protein
MQINLSKQNSINVSKRNLSSVTILVVVLIVFITVIAMVSIPGYGTLITGSIVIIAILRQLIVAINKKPLLLKITKNSIVYLSEERNELISIASDEIKEITHRFCELQILTKDDSIHHINLLNTDSEQTRWEIKELSKQLTERITKN